MATPLPRVTTATKEVLSILVADTVARHYGFKVAKLSGLQLKTVYRILDRLEEHGWLEGYWEANEKAKISRPARRYYKLTKAGFYLAARILDGRGQPESSFLDSIGFPDTHPIPHQGIRILQREDFGAKDNDDLRYGSSKFLFEISAHNNADIQFPTLVKSGINEPLDFSFRSIKIDGVDHTDDMNMQVKKITYDLIQMTRLSDMSIRIPSKMIQSNKCEVELSGVQDGRSPITALMLYPTEEYELRLELDNKKSIDFDLRSGPNQQDLELIHGVIDLTEDHIVEDEISYTGNEFSWKPKKVKTGFQYRLDRDSSLLVSDSA